MPIPSNVRNSIFWKEEFDEAEEEAKKKGLMASAESMIKDGMPLFKVNKYTRLGVRSLRELLQRMKNAESS